HSSSASPRPRARRFRWRSPASRSRPIQKTDTPTTLRPRPSRCTAPLATSSTTTRRRRCGSLTAARPASFTSRNLRRGLDALQLSALSVERELGERHVDGLRDCALGRIEQQLLALFGHLLIGGVDSDLGAHLRLSIAADGEDLFRQRVAKNRQL